MLFFVTVDDSLCVCWVWVGHSKGGSWGAGYFCPKVKGEGEGGFGPSCQWSSVILPPSVGIRAVYARTQRFAIGPYMHSGGDAVLQVHWDGMRQHVQARRCTGPVTIPGIMLCMPD